MAVEYFNPDVELAWYRDFTPNRLTTGWPDQRAGAWCGGVKPASTMAAVLDEVEKDTAIKKTNDNHELWHPCPVCGLEYDKRLTTKCPDCGK